MDNNIENSLNSLLQGEYMAVESFNIFVSKAQNKNYRDVFQDIQKQHRENISLLAEYIQNIGGKPDENLGLKGNMADIKISFNMYKKDDNFIKNKAIEGETNGINMTEKVLRGNLDDKSRDIVGEILHKDRKSIKRLKELN